MKPVYGFANCCTYLLQERDTREGLPPDRAGAKSFCKNYMVHQKFIQFFRKSREAFVVKTLE